MIDQYLCSVASKFLLLWMGIISVSAIPNTIKIKRQKAKITRQKLSATKNVETLDITINAIEGIEEGALCVLPELKTLIINGNKKFPKITRKFFECTPGLTFIHIYHNINLEMEPDSLSGLHQLEVLRLWDVDWSKLTKNTFASDHLRNLDFGSNKLTEIDADAFTLLSNLRSLHLIANVQTLKSGTFKNLNKLKKLQINGCPFEEIPWEALGSLPSLQLLTLVDTKIKEVDVEKLIQQFPKLRVLEIMGYPKEKKSNLKNELKRHNVYFGTDFYYDPQAPVINHDE